jgi:PAS domain S-box-containing protein
LWTADLAAQVLSGERPEDIPLAHNTDLQVTVDWRALRRWHIPESALPPGTLVLYREPTFWERDRRYILAAILVILAQALWIVASLWQRARKRKADSALKESEGRFQRMANTTPSLVWMCDGEGKVTYLNDRRIEFTGRDPNAGYDDVWTKYIHPDDIEAVLSANALGLERRENFSKQYRLRRKDGVYRWMFDVAAPRVNGDGSFAGFIGSAADITDQKLAQEALEKVGGQLIEAQEKERSRIARDLHDDICQRLAILSVELEQAGRNGVSPSTKKKLEEIEQHCAEITTDIQSLSHQLHSSKLDYLGLVEGTRAFCDELSNQFEVNVHFRSNKVPRALPKDISLCLFRIMQEALHNALKYSGVREFEVDLRGTAQAVQLEVRDAGVGFEVDVAKRGAGLGLVSMQERVHVLHGQLRVESRLGAGTKVLASVPFVAANERSSGAVKDWRVAV